MVKLADLGDLLVATPALRAIRNAHPTAHIAALVTPHTAAILRGSTAVDEVITFRKADFDSLGAGARRLGTAGSLARRLTTGQWDIVVLLHHLTTWFGTAKYAALALATRAPVRAGLDNGRGLFLTHRTTDYGFGTHHEADYWLQVAALIGGHNVTPTLEITPTEVDREWASGTIATLDPGQRFAVVHPGSGGFGMARRWFPDRFSDVARHLAKHHDLAPLVLAGTAAGESALAATVTSGAPDARAVGPAPSPGALTALLSRAALFIGGDSGVMHLAAAAGTPLVGIFGPTNHRAWGPYPADDPRRAIVREPLACSPCVYRGHSLGTPAGCAARTCLAFVDASDVIAAAERVLAVAHRPEASLV